ncbi:hypothetical protein [Nocardioides sp. SR21]|uniref:hypothetical protein n=1 Tax=Nocardioides sp. SR21 TaxID=2919501 RepID=UPI001FA946B6|nr:hypothetical protein [Nocardioides sp. SR21]
MQDWIGAAVAGVLALVALALGVALLRARSRTDRELGAARAETAEIKAQLEALEARLSRPEPRTTPEAEFVITNLGEPAADPEPVPKIDNTLFADIVLRETVVKAASLAHGLRRALDPETRHRIRYEMGREVKRARKQRRVDTRQARREWQARQRADEGPVGRGAA